MFSSDDLPHNIDPNVKSNNPMKYNRLYPNLSASHPEVGSATAIASIYAVITHSILSRPTPNDAIIFGKPTFTIVASRTAMKVPSMTLASKNHL
jgi:hypothetical protein